MQNKDIAILQNLNFLKLEVARLEETVSWERDRRNNLTQHLSIAPRGGGASGADDAIIRIEEAERQHEAQIVQYTKEIKKAERIIGSIPSYRMRNFVTMIYAEQVTESAVRSVLKMSRWEFDAVKSAIENVERMADVKWPGRA